MNSKENLEVPTESSSPLEKLQFEHAELYSAYQNRGLACDELELIISKYQKAFGDIDSLMQGVLR